MAPSPQPAVDASSTFTTSLFIRSLNENFATVKSQWQDPKDILTILMIIGGDVVRCAIAQMVGTSGEALAFAPVAFSFGWVAYSFSAILSAVGDRRLMPSPDYEVTCINVKSGQTRLNRSWNIGRLVRDYEPHNPEGRGLTISFFHTKQNAPKSANKDWVYWLGVFVILAQIGIACIPGAIRGNWVVLILTVGGTLLAMIGGSLPQWRQEKWSGRDIEPGKKEVVCLTNGNGSLTAMVIISEGTGIKLEDLAGARVRPTLITAPATFVLAGLWLVHLITVESLNSDAWYSLAIGALGMVQNAIAAGAKRSPDALGFHIVEDLESRIHRRKVFEAIKASENVEPRVGLCLIPIFFPGGLLEHEQDWVDAREGQLAEEKKRANDAKKLASRDNTMDSAFSEDGLKGSDTLPPILPFHASPR